MHGAERVKFELISHIGLELKLANLNIGWAGYLMKSVSIEIWTKQNMEILEYNVVSSFNRSEKNVHSGSFMYTYLRSGQIHDFYEQQLVVLVFRPC